MTDNKSYDGFLPQVYTSIFDWVKDNLEGCQEANAEATSDILTLIAFNESLPGTIWKTRIKQISFPDLVFDEEQRKQNTFGRTLGLGNAIIPKTTTIVDNERIVLLKFDAQIIRHWSSVNTVSNMVVYYVSMIVDGRLIHWGLFYTDLYQHAFHYNHFAKSKSEFLQGVRTDAIYSKITLLNNLEQVHLR